MKQIVNDGMFGPFMFGKVEPTDEAVLAMLDDPKQGLPRRQFAQVVNKVKDPDTGWQAQIHQWDEIEVPDEAQE